MTEIYLQEHTHSSATSESFPIIDLTACGVVRGDTLERFFGNEEYTLIYVIKGSGELRLGYKELALSAGETFICRPHEPKLFAPNVGEPTEYYWFCLRGRFVSDTLSLLKLTSKDKYFVGHDADLLMYMDKIIDEWNKNETASDVVAAALVTAMLGHVSRLAGRTVNTEQAKGHDKIAPAINSINSDCTSKLGVDDYAKMCNLSTSYFTHLFTSITGFSPMEYKQIQRINIAKNLLSTTNKSIKEISNIVGFKDPLYFGRCFKQATGHTPTNYRANK